MCRRLASGTLAGSLRRHNRSIRRDAVLLLISENFGVEPRLIRLVTLTPRLDWVAGGERPFPLFLMRESTAQNGRENGECIHFLLVSHTA
jgi:hypothetical protein